jgi:TIR domain
MESASTGSIFLSYRRADTRHVSGRLYDRLVDRFGRARIFMDVDSITPGADFITAVNAALSSCSVLISVIGPTWLANLHANQDGTEDFVALEIGTALNKGIRILPVLVDGTPVPRPDQLPRSLVNLSRRNAVRLDHESFRSDVDALLSTVESLLSEGSGNPTIVTPRHDRGRRRDAPNQIKPRFLFGKAAPRVLISEYRRLLEARSRIRSIFVAVVTSAVIAVASIIGTVRMSPTSPPIRPPISSPQGVSKSTTPSASRASPPHKVREEPTDFVRRYYSLLPRDPLKAFSLLSADTQRRQGGLATYILFYRSVMTVTFAGEQEVKKDVVVGTVSHLMKNGSTRLRPYRFELTTASDGAYLINRLSEV